MSYAKLFVKGSTVVIALSFVGMLLGYVLKLFFAVNLKLADFGLFYAILSFVSIFALFRDGLNTTLSRFISDFQARGEREGIKSTFVIVAALELVMSAVIMTPVIFFSDFIAVTYFKTLSASLPLKIIAASFVVSTLFLVIHSAFQGLSRMAFYSMLEPLRNTFVLLSAAVLISLGVFGISVSYLISAVLMLIVFFALFVKIFPFFKVRYKFTRSLGKNIVMFSVPLFFSAVATVILSQIDTIMITYFRSLEEVGLYHAALSTSQLLLLFAGSVSVVFLPIATTLWSKKKLGALSKAVNILLKFSFAFIIPFAIIMIAFPEIVIKLLFPNFNPLMIAPILQVLVIGSVFSTVFAIGTTAVLGINEPRMNMKVVMIISAINLVVNILLVPSMGAIGAGVATLFSYLVGAVLIVRFIRRKIEFSVPVKPMAKAFFGGVFTAAIFFVLKNRLLLAPFFEFLIIAAIGVVFYAAYLFFSRVVTKGDIDMLRETGIPVPRFVDKIAR